MTLKKSEQQSDKYGLGRILGGLSLRDVFSKMDSLSARVAALSAQKYMLTTSTKLVQLMEVLLRGYSHHLKTSKAYAIRVTTLRLRARGKPSALGFQTCFDRLNRLDQNVEGNKLCNM